MIYINFNYYALNIIANISKKSTKKWDKLLHKINNICRILPVGCELDKQKWVLYNDFINIYGRIYYV